MAAANNRTYRGNNKKPISILNVILMNPMKFPLSRWTGNSLQYQWYLFIYDSSSACYCCLIHKVLGFYWNLFCHLTMQGSMLIEYECAFYWFLFLTLLSRVWKLKIKASHTWIQNKCRGYELHEISQIMKNHKNFLFFSLFSFPLYLPKNC